MNCLAPLAASTRPTYFQATLTVIVIRSRNMSPGCCLCGGQLHGVQDTKARRPSKRGLVTGQAASASEDGAKTYGFAQASCRRLFTRPLYDPGENGG